MWEKAVLELTLAVYAGQGTVGSSNLVWDRGHPTTVGQGSWSLGGEVGVASGN